MNNTNITRTQLLMDLIDDTLTEEGITLQITQELTNNHTLKHGELLFGAEHMPAIIGGLWTLDGKGEFILDDWQSVSVADWHDLAVYFSKQHWDIITPQVFSDLRDTLMDDGVFPCACGSTHE